jgi:hypothetical protein
VSSKIDESSTPRNDYASTPKPDFVQRRVCSRGDATMLRLLEDGSAYDVRANASRGRLNGRERFDMRAQRQ